MDFLVAESITLMRPLSERLSDLVTSTAIFLPLDFMKQKCLRLEALAKISANSMQDYSPEKSADPEKYTFYSVRRLLLRWRTQKTYAVYSVLNSLLSISTVVRQTVSETMLSISKTIPCFSFSLRLFMFSIHSI